MRTKKNHFCFLSQCIPDRFTVVVATNCPFLCAGPVSSLFPQFHLSLAAALQAAPSNL